jgi:hypothetical protein
MTMLDRRHVLKGGLAAAAVAAMPLRAAQATRVKAPFPIFDTHPHF